jgi:hypothetical protein
MRAPRRSRSRQEPRRLTHEERRLEESEYRSAHWKRWALISVSGPGGMTPAATRHPVWDDGYTAALINFTYLAKAVMTTDEVIDAMHKSQNDATTQGF